MSRQRKLSPLAFLAAVLLITLAGCITVVAPQPPAPPAPPVITSFTATPATIEAGQSTTLSWDVSGAASVTIEPELGSVAPSGSLKIIPQGTTTYTLTAVGEGGSTAASVTVTIAAAAQPDLVITDLWLQGSIVYYKIKNQGSGTAGQSRSYLYINNQKFSTDFVDKLAAGEETTASFANLEWNFPMAPYGDVPAEMPSMHVKICADAEDSISEEDEGNNCLSQVWGEKFSYDFVTNAHMASWRSSAGRLSWPMTELDKKGAAFIVSNSLVMCPEQTSQGWIQGRFAEFYYHRQTDSIRSRELVVPPVAKFTAKVGFYGPGKSTDGARIALGYLDATGSVVLFPKMDIYSDGTTRVYQVGLSDLAGMKTEFILWVEAKESPQGDCVRWYQPRIVQE